MARSVVLVGDRQPVVAYFPVPDGKVLLEGNRPAERWMLDLLGGFTRVQDVITSCLAAYLHNKSPRLTKVIEKKHFTRLRDDDRWKYVEAMAQDVGYTTDLIVARHAFEQCQGVRNVIGHSYSLEPLYDPAIQTYRYFVDRTRHEDIPDPLTPAVLRQLVAECRWLEAVVLYIAYKGGVEFWSPFPCRHEDGTSHRPLLKPPEPGLLPTDADWVAPQPTPLPCDGAFPGPK